MASQQEIENELDRILPDPDAHDPIRGMCPSDLALEAGWRVFKSHGIGRSAASVQTICLHRANARRRNRNDRGS